MKRPLVFPSAIVKQKIIHRKSYTIEYRVLLTSKNTSKKSEQIVKKSAIWCSDRPISWRHSRSLGTLPILLIKRRVDSNIDFKCIVHNRMQTPVGNKMNNFSSIPIYNNKATETQHYGSWLGIIYWQTSLIDTNEFVLFEIYWRENVKTLLARWSKTNTKCVCINTVTVQAVEFTIQTAEQIVTMWPTNR